MATIEIKDLEKQKKQLKASFNMWEKTITETEEKMKNAENEDGSPKFSESDIEERLNLLKNGQQDIIDKWIFLGGTIDELKNGELKKEKPVVKKKTNASSTKTIQEKIEEATKKVAEIDNIVEEDEKHDDVQVRKVSQDNRNVTIPKIDDANPLASYDIIPLPSNGECYSNKKGRIAVSYLTAKDENIIVSPNLYRDNMVLDVILKEKIRDTEIDPDDLLDGDRDAIILFLRSSAYGNMYPVMVTDPETGNKFEANIDLSKLKYKDFTLTSDENGYFDFKMPVTGDLVKFKFLSHKDYVNLARLEEVEMEQYRKSVIENFSERLRFFLKEDKKLSGNRKNELENAVKVIDEWGKQSGEEKLDYSHRTTNEMEMEIMSINGNSDRNFIHGYIEKMPIKDSTALRRYIQKNTPGVDYNFEVKKPESLGGGSMKAFLQFDQFIFLTDSE